MVLAKKHNHSGFLSIDIMAQTSRLKRIDPTLKCLVLFALAIICVASKSTYTGIFLTLAMFVLAVIFGGVRVHHYVQTLMLPAVFLFTGGLALLFEVTSEPVGVLCFRVLGFWLSVSVNSQIQTSLVVSRAFGAVSCLCLLGSTTPMPDIVSVLRRARFPVAIIDLMYLIYRYIFVLISIHHDMRMAARSRLGFRGYRSSMRTNGMVFSTLLGRSYRMASRNFDAMESRCYEKGICFMGNRSRIAFSHIAISTTLILFSFLTSILFG